MKTLKPRFFPTAKHFRAWLEKNHQSKEELIVGFYKKASGKPSITWPESVDQALCFGWIDGIRRALDAESYCIRFTPRKPNSHWSNVNLSKMKVLLEAGLVHPAGLDAYKRKEAERSGNASYEQGAVTLPKDALGIFKKNKKAWSFFKNQAPSYIKIATWWVISAKRSETRRLRLQTLIKDSEAGLKIKSQRR